ncbi:MAG: cobalt ECF transporter T component CbiQ [Dehalococcoidia bacterium]
MAISIPSIERYQAGSSPIHNMDARVKLPLTLAYIFAATLTPVGHWLAFGLLAAPLAMALAASRLPPLLVLRRSALALPFIVVAVPLLFTKEGDALFRLQPFGWTASEQGLVAVLTIFAKSWLAVTAAVILTATTPALELLRAMRTLAVPRLLVATVSFMYRYLFVIVEEAKRLLRARDSRSASLEGHKCGGGFAWRAGVLGQMIGSLSLRSYERSERVYAAMQARGYDGEPRFLWDNAWRLAEIMVALAVALYVAGVQVYARY